MDSSSLRFMSLQCSELDRACDIVEMSITDFGENIPESHLHWKNFYDLVEKLSVCSKELRSIQSEMQARTLKLIS